MKRKSKRGGFGVLTHANVKRGGHISRHLTIRVNITRNHGAPKGHGYNAKACVAGSTSTAAIVMARKALRRKGNVDMNSAAAWDFSRCGDSSGPTPTVATKRALNVLTKKTWSR